MAKKKDYFDFIVKMGEEMLKSGGEIFRTEDLMNRMAATLKLEEFNCFILANGVLVSAVIENEYYSKVLHVPISPMNLSKIDAVNTLSREMVTGKLSLVQAQERLQEIIHQPEISLPVKMGAYVIGSASFCYLFGGALIDAALSSIAGLFLVLYFTYLVPKLDLGKAMTNIIASSGVTLYACVLTAFLPFLNIDTIIIGGIITLVPGVSLVTGFRYLFTDDLSSGLVRLTDALLIALCISVGVGGMLRMWNWF